MHAGHTAHARHTNKNSGTEEHDWIKNYTCENNRILQKKPEICILHIVLVRLGGFEEFSPILVFKTVISGLRSLTHLCRFTRESFMLKTSYRDSDRPTPLSFPKASSVAEFGYVLDGLICQTHVGWKEHLAKAQTRRSVSIVLGTTSSRKRSTACVESAKRSWPRYPHPHL